MAIHRGKRDAEVVGSQRKQKNKKERRGKKRKRGEGDEVGVYVHLGQRPKTGN